MGARNEKNIIDNSNQNKNILNNFQNTETINEDRNNNKNKEKLLESPIASKLMELFEDCQKKNCEYIIDFYDEETQNPKYWLVIYTGIEGTPYEKGLFKVKLIFPDNYPKSMPRAHFITKIYHLNIKDPDDGGDVCLKEMNKNEDQIYENECDIIKYLDKIYYMFCKNNPDSAFTFKDDRVNEYKNDRKKFDETARNWTKKYASLDSFT